MYLSVTNAMQGFIEVSIDDVKCGRLTYRLNNHTERTSKNFHECILGNQFFNIKDKKTVESKNQSDPDVFPLHYKDCMFHRIFPDFCILGGDIEYGKVNSETREIGSGSISIYGKKFENESSRIKHDKIGIISMANSGSDSSGSQFLITLGPAPFLDGKSVAFGEIIDGFDILKLIESKGTYGSGRPRALVKISDCGIIKGAEKMIC